MSVVPGVSTHKNGLGFGHFLLINHVKPLTEQGLAFNDGLYLLQLVSIGRIGYPQLNISVDGILFGHMHDKTLPLLLWGDIGIFLKSKLYCPPEDHLGIKVAVGFGDNLTINGARLATG